MKGTNKILEERQVFSRMYKNQDRSTKRDNLSSFVQEFTFEEAAENDLFQNLIQIFKPTRKLKPNVVSCKKVNFLMEIYKNLIGIYH